MVAKPQSRPIHRRFQAGMSLLETMIALAILLIPTPKRTPRNFRPATPPARILLPVRRGLVWLLVEVRIPVLRWPHRETDMWTTWTYPEIPSPARAPGSTFAYGRFRSS